MGQRESRSGMSGKQRVMATLDWRIEKRLLSYAVAATAAGVGTMACSLPAGAKVVSTSTFVQIPPNIMVNLDLNGDGIPDFQFSNNNNSSGSSSVLRGNLKVLPQNQGNAIWGASAYASALGPGVVVGSNGAFQQGHEFMAHATHFCHSSCLYRSGGPWKEATRLYLGFQFTILGQMHYGWARVSVAATDGGVYAAVTGYAYETVPNVSIVTGQTTGNLKKTQDASKRSSASLGPSASQPASLGLLARGSLGLDAWRRRDAGHTG
jgi:hypothetical protein